MKELCNFAHYLYNVLHNEAKFTDREPPISSISARWGKSANVGHFSSKAKQMVDGIFLP